MRLSHFAAPHLALLVPHTRHYAKLAGMSGTALPAAGEFYELYRLTVVQVRAHMPFK